MEKKFEKDMVESEKEELEARLKYMSEKYQRLLQRLRQLSPDSKSNSKSVFYLRDGGISMKELVKLLKTTFNGINVNENGNNQQL